MAIQVQGLIQGKQMTKLNELVARDPVEQLLLSDPMISFNKVILQEFLREWRNVKKLSFSELPHKQITDGKIALVYKGERKQVNLTPEQVTERNLERETFEHDYVFLHVGTKTHVVTRKLADELRVAHDEQR